MVTRNLELTGAAEIVNMVKKIWHLDFISRLKIPTLQFTRLCIHIRGEISHPWKG